MLAGRGAISPCDPSQPLGHAEFQAALGHQLHADADAQKRRAFGHAAEHRLLQPRDSGKAGGAVGKRALARKNDPIRPPDQLRVRGDADVGGQALLFRREGKPPRGRGKIAAAVINDGSSATHQREPLVEGIWPALRASGATAMRSARAAALNVASATWCALVPAN